MYSMLTQLLGLFAFGLTAFQFLQADALEDRVIIGFIGIAVAIMAILLTRNAYVLNRAKERHREVKNELTQAQEAAKNLDEQKTEFASIASHQLRSPLTSINGYASLILENAYGAVPEKIQEAVEKIYASGQLMQRSVEDFLNISRIEQGRMQYDKTTFDVYRLCGSVADELLPAVKERGLRLSITSDEHDNYCVRADKQKIRHVIVNLVDNAIKYTPEGDITIRLERKKNAVRIAVIDTGIGLSKEDQQKLFRKFKRAGNANDVHVSGTGIGLYIAKQIVDAHGGNIWVQSEGVDSGSTFYIELPAHGEEC